MKKVLLFLFLMFISINVYASAPADEAITIQGDSFHKGDRIEVIRWIVSGDKINPYRQENTLEFAFDTNQFQFISFQTNYDYTYDENTFLVTSPSNFAFPIFVRNKEDIRPLWVITLECKEDLEETTFKIERGYFSKDKKAYYAYGDGTYLETAEQKYKDYDYTLTPEMNEAYQKEYKEWLETKKIEEEQVPPEEEIVTADGELISENEDTTDEQEEVTINLTPLIV